MENYRSESGEDRILARIFDGVLKGTCVEVGAYNGVDFSNTYYFERIGWHCILVEPNPGMWTVIRQARHALLFECAASGCESQAMLHVKVGDQLCSTLEMAAIEPSKKPGPEYCDVPVKTRRLDDMLEECRVEHLDFVSIDVEGHELEVLEGFDIKRWNPRVVILEDNSNLRDSSVLDFMLARGYARFFRTGVNDWYAAPGTLNLSTFRCLLTCGPVRLTRGLVMAWMPQFALFLLAIKRAVKRAGQPAPLEP